MPGQTMNGSAAYDFGRFQSKEQLRSKTPKLTVARPSASAAQKQREFAAALKILFALIAVTVVITVMLCSNAALTELNMRIATQQKLLEEQLSETTRLSASLESQISLRNVEQYATRSLGMSTMDKHQITYVDLSEGDRIELTGQSPRKTLADRIRLALHNVQEYITSE